MTDSAEARAPILAAGGIVLRVGSRPRIAIVRLRRDKSSVLPKGKLNPGERALAAAKREVMEETGHEVSVHEFLGSMSYPVDGKIKIVQFWHMRATRGPVRELAYEIKAVKWLPLKQAIERLTRVHEKVLRPQGNRAVCARRVHQAGKSQSGQAREPALLHRSSRAIARSRLVRIFRR
jgi:8-oxo-dGTP diphosphatase